MTQTTHTVDVISVQAVQEVFMRSRLGLITLHG
jgi:hypothetical protein